MGIDGHERFHISGSRIDAANGARPWAEIAATLAARPWTHPRSQGNPRVFDGERQLFRTSAPTNPREGT